MSKSLARARLYQTIVGCLLAICAFSPAQADWKDDVGYTQLVAELGVVPNGSGVVVSQVEVDPSGTALIDYFPNAGHSQFSGKTIVDVTGTNQANSGHATFVGRTFYGNVDSIAPGVTDVDVYEANDYLNFALGFAGSANPVAQPYQVQNHSWIGTTSEAAATSILQRLDYTIDTQEMTTLAGLNNSVGAVPQLMTHSYNALSIGLTDENETFSFGLTTFYGAGRSKPSLVAPSAATSFATAMVSSASALLHEAGAGTDAVLSEPLRAILMAGATKDEFTSWSHTPTSPLDLRVGAGELNVRNSYYMIAGGQYTGSSGDPASAAPDSGWDYRPSLSAANMRYYEFVVPEFMVAAELSSILTWNVLITDTSGNPNTFIPTDSLADMNLTFYDSTNSFLDSQLDESISSVDNVEHIYATELKEGTYTLEVSTDTTRDYGLAWRMLLFDVADTDRDGDVDTADLTTMFQNFTGDVGLAGGKTFAEGDTDQDGDVDTADVTTGFQTFTGVLAALSSLDSSRLTTPVPEPGSLLLFSLGLVGLGLRMRQGRRDK